MLELLIAIGIMLILLAITASALKITNDSDRVRAAGRQIQSYLLGARDRAIYAKAPRGVRFLRGGTGTTVTDPTDRANRLVTSMVYVEPTDPWQGQVMIVPNDPTQPYNAASNQLVRLRLRDLSVVPDWLALQSRGLLAPGLRVQIPASNRGTWYAIYGVQLNQSYNNDLYGPGNGPFQEILLSTEYRSANPTGLNYEKASIELPPSVMPNQEPIQLPKGVAIDLDRCGYWKNVGSCRDYTQNTNDPLYWPEKLPQSWQGGVSSDNLRSEYNQRMDLMFSPRGTITGPPAAQGIIHLYVTETLNLAGLPTTVALSSSANPAGVTYAQLMDAGYGTNATGGKADPPIPNKVLTTIFTRTGQVTCTPVRTDDNYSNSYVNTTSGQDGFADDPFYFAERGEVAGR